MRKVSVIIVNYNAGDMLRQTVKPLLELSSIAEIFVVDNASEDGSIKAIESLNPASTVLKCIRNNKNIGFARACNIALAASSGDYLLFLNPDCIVEHGALEKLIDCLEGFPQAAMVGPLLLNPDGTEQAGGRRAVPTPWRSFVRVSGLSRLSRRYPRFFYDFMLYKEPLPEKPIEVEAISGSFMLVKKEAIDDVGVLDEGYFMHCEDLDWCMRFRQRGWKIIFVPEASVIHYQGTCSHARPVFVEWNKHKGMVRFYRKFFRHRYPGVLFWMVVSSVWIRFSMIAAYHALRKIKDRLIL